MWRSVWLGLVLALLVASGATPGAAQPGGPPPEGTPAPLRLLVGFPAGGSIDRVARTFAEGLAAELGRPVLVENRTGGRGAAAAEAISAAPPDGATLGLVAASTLVLDRHTGRGGAQGLLAPISRVAGLPLIVLAAPQGPRDIGELADALRARPGACGTPGAGSLQHLTTELLVRSLGTRCDMLHLRGSRGAVEELLAGGIQVYVETAVIGLPLVREGRVRPLAVTSRARSSLLPDVPTVGEAVLGFEAETWLALMGPPGLPDALLARFEAAAIAAARMPAVAERLRALAAEPMAGTRAELAATIRAQDSIWGPVARAAGMTAD